MTPEQKAREDITLVAPYADIFAKVVRTVASHKPQSNRVALERLLDPQFVEAAIGDMKASPNFETRKLLKRKG